MTTTTRASTNGRAPADRDEVMDALAAVEASSRPKSWPWLLAGLVVGFGVAVAVLTYLSGDTSSAVATQEVESATAEVSVRDLTEEIEWSATLQYGDAAPVAGSGGTITAIADAGAIVVRGDVAATIDATPLVVFYGDAPLWRTMGEGDEGHDVYLLESNLAALGYDPDETVDIDETFTANTAAMVERWQDDLGIEPTGTVGPGNVVVAAGPAAVSEPAAVGAAATGTILTLSPRTSVIDVVAATDGVVSGLAPEGTPIEQGMVLFEVGDIAVVAETTTDAVDTATENDSETDTESESDTESDDVVVVAVPDGFVVGTHLVADGATVSGGGPVITTARSELRVSISVDVAEADEFALDQTVTIELADESTVTGAVTDISDVIRPAANTDTPSVDITVAVVGADDADVVEGPVTVISTGSEVLDATVVPTRALVSVIEGGFAVEVVNDDGTTSLVGVELGVFDDGVVEVVDGAVEPGMTVVVPA